MADDGPDTSIEVRLSPTAAADELRADARAGLTDNPKWLRPRWFYDDLGSDLFEQITTLPEYYPTRAEREILDARAATVAARTSAATLVELGSGSSLKTRLLLTALREHGSLRDFVPLDVSVSALSASVEAIAQDYPGLVIRGIVGDFTAHLGDLPATPKRLVAFLGGTIGNLLPDERAVFLASVRESLSPGEWLLLGTDLVKDPGTLVAAYDDSAGVTAEFNRNVLRVLNRELEADFDVDAFRHVAVWNAEHEWIEMRLIAERPMEVKIPGIDLVISFETGEPLLTEISAKFRVEGVAAELAAANFTLDASWTDEQGRFAVALARAV